MNNLRTFEEFNWKNLLDPTGEIRKKFKKKNSKDLLEDPDMIDGDPYGEENWDEEVEQKAAIVANRMQKSRW